MRRIYQLMNDSENVIPITPIYRSDRFNYLFPILCGILNTVFYDGFILNPKIELVYWIGIGMFLVLGQITFSIRYSIDIRSRYSLLTIVTMAVSVVLGVIYDQPILFLIPGLLLVLYGIQWLKYPNWRDVLADEFNDLPSVLENSSFGSRNSLYFLDLTREPDERIMYLANTFQPEYVIVSSKYNGETRHNFCVPTQVVTLPSPVLSSMRYSVIALVIVLISTYLVSWIVRGVINLDVYFFSVLVMWMTISDYYPFMKKLPVKEINGGIPPPITLGKVLGIHLILMIPYMLVNGFPIVLFSIVSAILISFWK